ncbi:MAG: ferritin-like fold-containing protein [Actinomycetota bacterium]|nr:ferritin-like fold-containing protein [Actinomycetota bacterium]MDA2980498.1 ferritin-like fold-containing protein [Actinomycetota bacterium]MDA3002808.1 ferritin-like fold-containing protein [Actinomycetota bacterium]
MPWWWKKKKADKSSLSITPRDEERIASKVDLGALAPPLADYLATACSLQHALAAKLSTLSGGAWGSEDADDLGLAAGWAMDRYRRLREVLEDYVEDVPAALAGPRDRLATHLDRMESARWYEGVGTVYVVTGFTRDFWHRLAEGFAPEITTLLQGILADTGDEDVMAGVLERFLAVDARYSSRLSLWCRRLVGDTILICRDGLSEASMARADAEVRLEPVLTDVVALHTKRLDRLGLTA